MEHSIWHILLVDDDEDDFFLTREMLSDVRRGSFNLHWAPSYTVGLDALREGKYDAVLVDYSLGVRTGLDFIRSALESGVRSPMIMLTGHGSYDVDVEAMQAGAADYLSKIGLNSALLERSIRYAIERNWAEQVRERSLDHLKHLFQVSNQVLAEKTLSGILQTIVAAACQLTEAQLGAAWHGFSGDHFQVGVIQGPDGAVVVEDYQMTADWGGVYQDLMEKGVSVRMTQAELERYPLRWGLPENHQPLNGLLGARLVNASGQPNGMLMVSNKAQGDFSAEDEALLQQLAALASLSLQNVEARQAAEQSAAQARSTAIELAVELAERKRTDAELRKSQERLRVALASVPLVVYTQDQDLNTTWLYHAKNGYLGENLNGSREISVVTPDDAAETLALKQQVISTGKGVRSEVWASKNGNTVLYDTTIEPLHNAQGQVIGLTVAGLDITEKRRLETQQMENAMHREVQRRLAQHREMERLQIARDLHDGPLQDVIAANFGLVEVIGMTEGHECQARLQWVQETLQKNIRELRTFCNELRPPALAPFGLERAIQSYMQTFRERNPGIKVRLNLERDGKLLAEDRRMTLYRIFQELLNNVSKHSQATEVSVCLRVNEQEITLVVEDNGVGFIVPGNWVEMAKKGHLGLIGMGERVDLVNGRLVIESSPGNGTRVMVTAPVKE